MSKVIAVIGAGYGDEGKGLMTDYFAASEDNAIVVRSNGGAQAGHTVTTPDGQRRVFSHIGSGTLSGTPTYLSEFFVANPFLLKRELSNFHQDAIHMMKIYAHPDVIVTTPYDMLLNQRFEMERGDDKLHGSVGVGFNETIERDLLKPEFTITIGELNRWNTGGEQTLRAKLILMLDRIRSVYVPSRVDLTQVSGTFKQILTNDNLIEETIEDIIAMMSVIKLSRYSALAGKTVIFEGAQGLMLDQDYGHFPHVTRSNCGMRNMIQIVDQIPGGVNEDDFTVNYVTRAYVTRHGAGPLASENPDMVIQHDIVDKTNVPNDWQGSLRFAPLNLDNFNSITDKDFLNYAPRTAKKVTTITCLDQLAGDVVSWTDREQTRYMTPDKVRDSASRIFDFCSYGPTREDVVDFYTKG